MRTDAEAEDVTSEVFQRALVAMPRYEMSGAIVGPTRKSPPHAEAPTSESARSNLMACAGPRCIPIRVMHAQHVKRLQILIEGGAGR